jgi:hypothetical protein
MPNCTLYKGQPTFILTLQVGFDIARPLYSLIQMCTTCAKICGGARSKKSRCQGLAGNRHTDQPRTLRNGNRRSSQESNHANDLCAWYLNWPRWWTWITGGQYASNSQYYKCNFLNCIIESITKVSLLSIFPKMPAWCQASAILYPQDIAGDYQ